MDPTNIRFDKTHEDNLQDIQNCSKTFDKNFHDNVLRSTEYLERFLNKKPKKKSHLNEDDIRFFISQPSSNTVN